MHPGVGWVSNALSWAHEFEKEEKEGEVEPGQQLETVAIWAAQVQMCTRAVLALVLYGVVMCTVPCCCARYL